MTDKELKKLSRAELLEMLIEQSKRADELQAKLDKAEKQYSQGEYTTLLPGESVTEMLKRCGYDL